MKTVFLTLALLCGVFASKAETIWLSVTNNYGLITVVASSPVKHSISEVYVQYQAMNYTTGHAYIYGLDAGKTYDQTYVQDADQGNNSAVICSFTINGVTYNEDINPTATLGDVTYVIQP